MAIVEGNKQNAPGGSVVHTRSKFPLSYEFFDTHRFGEYHPHFWFDGVEGDENVRLRSSHDVRSYTLKAPLLQDVMMKKDYFMIPLMAILPINWDKYNAIPVNGDDVLDDVGCGVADFWSKVSDLFNAIRANLSARLSASGSTAEQCILRSFLLLNTGEYFYSSGSLMNSMGARGNRNRFFYDSTAKKQIGYDDWYDEFISVLKTIVKDFTVTFPDDPSTSYLVKFDGSDISDVLATAQIDTHTFLQRLRDNGTLSVSSVTLIGTLAAAKTAITTFLNKYTDFSASYGNYNLSRVFAYQLVCAHYYSNDHIDYIFSASLYRELIGNYIRSSGVGVQSFTFNSLSYQYDYCSAKHFTEMVAAAVTAFTNNASSSDYLAYLAAIFAYRSSLRYLDYFTGTRSQPLAVGDVNVDVNTVAGNSYVSAIDITKGVSRQRLLNAVNRVGAKWDHYIELMSGRKPAPDFHNPFYLGHTADIVYGSESEYTGNVSDSDSQNVTCVLRSKGGRYEFNVDFVDRPCLIIGLTYYDLSRVYGRAFERQTFIMNRYDMFNKFMQFIGDQAVNKLEIGTTDPNSTGPVSIGTWAYQNRDMQYKQRFNQLAGGFGVDSTQLDNWIYRADDARIRSFSISPSFIRSVNAEFDKFFLSLTGYSLGTYFHFIVRNINDCSASRPMAANPSIL